MRIPERAGPVIGPASPKSYFLKCLSNDLDHLNAVVRGWNLVFRQLDYGDFRANLIQVGDRHHHFDYLSMNRYVDQGGGSPPGVWTFSFLTESSSPLIWRECKIYRDRLLVYSPSDRIEAQSRPGFEMFSLSFSEDVLTYVGMKAGIATMEHLPERGGIAKPHHAAMRNLRRYIHGYYCDIRNHPSAREVRRFSDALQYKIPRRLVETLASSSREETIPSSRMREGALRRALNIISQTADEPPMVGDLCRLAGASERLLRYAFFERFGVSPKAYLMAFRLNGARKELREAHWSREKVIDIANRWGFWHMGQFAADYRQHFGELPSQTMKEAPKGSFENLMMVDKNANNLFNPLGASSTSEFLIIRLNGVRQELQRGNPSSINVVEVARSWGFWDMVRFQADYRRLFGELPAETLAGNASLPGVRTGRAEG